MVSEGAVSVGQRATSDEASLIPALAIVGPTASGKSALGFWMAQAGLPVEIISLDSALVFRDMNIGTAKPLPHELALVPHHLMDILSPEESFSAADFVTRCHALIADIRARGRVPVILGGTMMYYNALVFGIDPLPVADAAVRAEITEFARVQGWPAVHAELAKVDAITAARLFPNDSQRLQRALEVFRMTGQPLSAFHARGDNPIHTLPTLSLEPADRSLLHARIEARFHDMLKAGFVQEVQALREKYVLHEGLPSMRCVGYRQVWQYLDGHIQWQSMIDQGVAATRQLAKRQITWLRSLGPKQVVDPFSSDWMSQVCPWLEAQVTVLLPPKTQTEY